MKSVALKGEKEKNMIEVTEGASKAIKAFMEEKQMDSALRVYLQSGG
jgi:Fe-S cluster assembly iron-binding protein IscA